MTSDGHARTSTIDPSCVPPVAHAAVGMLEATCRSRARSLSSATRAAPAAKTRKASRASRGIPNSAEREARHSKFCLISRDSRSFTSIPPVSHACDRAHKNRRRFQRLLTRPERFELPTFGSVDRRSIQLSYGRLAVDSSPAAGAAPTCVRSPRRRGISRLRRRPPGARSSARR